MQDKLMETVGKAKLGDSEAATELYNLTERMVYFTALKIVSDEEEARNIVQDTYIKIFTELPNLHRDEAFISWVRLIVVNLSKDHMKKCNPVLFRANEDEEWMINSIPEISEDFLPQKYAKRKEKSRLVMQIIDSLPDAQRMTVIVYYYIGFTIGDVARIMEVSEDTVLNRLNYARMHIRDEVDKLEKEGTRLYVFSVFLLSQILNNASLEYSLPNKVSEHILIEAMRLAAEAHRQA